jgi:hypothetical protein
MGSGSTTTETKISDWQRQKVDDVTGYGTQNIQNGSVNIPTQQIAQLNPLETQATSALQGYDYGQPQYQQAQDIYSGIANMTPQDYAAMTQANMNPYQDQVVGSMEAVAARRRAQERIGEEGAITQAGAFGGNRRDVYQGERQGAYEVGQNQVVADLMRQGYDQATAQTMSQLGNRSAAAGGIMSGAGASGNQFLSGIAAQMGAGGLGRGIEQAGYDATFNQGMTQYEDPFKRYAALVGGLSGVPNEGTSTATKKAGLLDYVQAGAQAASGTNFGAPNSDIRLKKNIKPTGKIGEFNSYTWEWNAEGKRIGADRFPTSGVIAQEVAKIRPELVATDAHGYLTVNYAGI